MIEYITYQRVSTCNFDSQLGSLAECCVLWSLGGQHEAVESVLTMRDTQVYIDCERARTRQSGAQGDLQVEKEVKDEFNYTGYGYPN